MKTHNHSHHTSHSNNSGSKLGNFARKEPILLIGMILFLVIAVCWIMSSLEMWPEKVEAKPTGAMAFEPGDSMTWIGMEVIPVNRSLRKDFKLSRKVKGMFVLNEGRDIAKKYGVKTGDVIVSIGRKPVNSITSFVDVANNVKYMDGILLEIYRDKKVTYLTIPFEYQYGPLMGPNKGSWQMGSPIVGPAFPYGPIFSGNNTTNNANNTRTF
ncbi:MAG: PDZ domain-containing protein [Candidatus Omnitrophica bacterium]|nr:PDZ domain-containing protein [Candidatus Omnitrophota bacterium]